MSCSGRCRSRARARPRRSRRRSPGFNAHGRAARPADRRPRRRLDRGSVGVQRGGGGARRRRLGDPDHLRGRPRDRHHACATSPPTCARRRRPPRPRWRCRCGPNCWPRCASSARAPNAAPGGRWSAAPSSCRRCCATGPSARPCSRPQRQRLDELAERLPRGLARPARPGARRARPGRRRAPARPAGQPPTAAPGSGSTRLWRVAQLAHPEKPLERGYAWVAGPRRQDADHARRRRARRGCCGSTSATATVDAAVERPKRAAYGKGKADQPKLL